MIATELVCGAGRFEEKAAKDPERFWGEARPHLLVSLA